MKQKLFSTLVAVAIGILSVAAGEPEKLNLNVGNIENIHIVDGIDVVLIQAPYEDNAIVLDQLTSEKLNVELSNKTLYIGKRAGKSKEKPVVHIYVNNLKNLTVNGGSDVKTFGTLKTGLLDVFVEGNSKVHIKTTGIVRPHSLNDAELKVTYLSKAEPAKKPY
ncbi:GIN domain-containing protein [Terrimonas alba]|uniref:GIN domain-containing protein n=1 Tax=Terrimonas alba TaxID=3349636 RepID=UPI0035F39590